MENRHTKFGSDNDWASPFSGNPLRVMIADDHNLVAEAVSRVLSSDFGLITTTAHSTKDLTDKVKSADPFDVILLDIQMDGMRGLESIKELCKSLHPAKVVLFSGSCDASFVKQAIDKGARGIIPKEMHIRAIESAIRLVHNGEIFLPASMSSAILAGSNLDAQKSTLTDLEKRVLELTASGCTNKEIAIQTGLKEIQIKMIMRTICKKLDAKNRTHAVVKAREIMII